MSSTSSATTCAAVTSASSPPTSWTTATSSVSSSSTPSSSSLSSSSTSSTSTELSNTATDQKLPSQEELTKLLVTIIKSKELLEAELKDGVIKDAATRKQLENFPQEMQRSLNLLQNNLKDIPRFREERVKECERMSDGIDAHISFIESKSTDRRDAEHAKTLLEVIKKNYATFKSKIAPETPQPILTNTHLDSERLRLEQQLLCLHQATKETFTATLKQIATANSHYTVPRSCYISYALADVKTLEEKHVQAFLTQLKADLRLAGIMAKDIQDNPSGNLNEYLESEIKKANYILVIGTPALLREHHIGSNQLVAIEKRRKTESKCILPILLIGESEAAFPTGFGGGGTVITDWRSNSYQANLKRLLQNLYQVGINDLSYQGIWQRFEDKYPFLTKKLLPEVVPRLLLAEKAGQSQLEHDIDDLIAEQLSPGSKNSATSTATATPISKSQEKKSQDTIMPTMTAISQAKQSLEKALMDKAIKHQAILDWLKVIPEILQVNRTKLQTDILPHVMIAECDRIINLMLSRITLIKTEGSADSQEKKLAVKLLEDIANSYVAFKNSLDSPKSLGPTSADISWKSERLRLEQKLLCTHQQASKEFAAVLQQIRSYVEMNYTIPKYCYISYAWPEKKNQDEAWVQSFLVQFRADLRTAGVAIKLDITNDQPGNAHLYLREFMEADYIIVIGTLSLRNKHLQGTGAICNELSLVAKKLTTDRNSVIPILLTGNFDIAFPAYFFMLTIQDWREHSYQANIKNLLRRLYQIPTDDNAYQQLWQSFEEKYTYLTKPMSQQIVEEQLKAEVAQRQLIMERDNQAVRQLYQEVKATADLAVYPLSSSSTTIFTSSTSSAISETDSTTKAKIKLEPIYTDVHIALSKFYARQNNIANSIDGKEFPIIKVQLSLVNERCIEKSTRDAVSAQNSKDAKAQPNVNKDHEDWHEAKQTIEVEKLFELTDEEQEKDNRAVKNKSVNKVRVVGPAGIGKTTFTQYVAYKWATADLWTDRFEYLFWIRLINLSNYTNEKNITLVDIVFNECLPHETRRKAEIESLKNNIETILVDYKEKTLIVLDGYDEITGLLAEDRIIKRIFDELMDCQNVLLTSRAYRLDGLQNITFDRKLENCGFSPEQITEYVDNYFADQKDLAAVMKAWLESQEMVMGLAHIPVNLNILCAVSDRFLKAKTQVVQTSIDTKDSRESKDVKAEQLPTVTTTVEEDEFNLATIYREMLSYFLYNHYLIPNHYVTGNDIVASDRIEMKCANELSYLGNLALKALQHEGQTIIQQDIFAAVDTETDAKELDRIKNPVLKMGLLRAIDNGCIQDRLKPYEFLHLNFQEFLAARYLVQLLKSDRESHVEAARKFFRMEKYNPNYYMVFNFAAGLVHLEEKAVLEAFWQELLSEPYDLIGIGHITLMIRSLDACMLDKRIPNLAIRIKEIQSWLEMMIYQKEHYKSNAVLSNIFDGFFIPTLKSSSVVLIKCICEDIFIKALAANATNIKAAALDTISAIGEKAVTAKILSRTIKIIMSLDIEEKILKEEKDVSRAAFTVIASISKRSATPEILSWIREALDTKEDNIRRVALNVIERFGETAATSEILSWIKGALEAKANNVLKTALDVVVKIGAKAATPEILNWLRGALDSKEEDVRSVVLDTIRRLGAKAATSEILSWLRGALDSKEEDIRRAALNTIEGLGAKAATPEILSWFRGALFSKEEKLRIVTLYAIAKLGAKVTTQEILHGIIVALDSKEEDVRRAAFYTIGELGVKVATPGILHGIVVALDSKEKDFRRAALDTIGKLGAKVATPEILRGIVVTLASKEEDLRKAALYTIGKLGAKVATPEILCGIRVALDAKEEYVRSAALGAIESIGEQGATSEILTGITKALDAKEKIVRISALAAIESIGEKAATPEILSWITGALNTKENDSTMQSYAAQALSRIAAKIATPKILELLISRLTADKTSNYLDSKKTISYLLAVPLSTQFMTYLDSSSTISPSILVNLALLQGIAITLTDTSLQIYGNRQNFTIALPSDKNIKQQWINTLKQVFSSPIPITQDNRLVTTVVPSASASTSSASSALGSTVISQTLPLSNENLIAKIKQAQTSLEKGIQSKNIQDQEILRQLQKFPDLIQLSLEAMQKKLTDAALQGEIITECTYICDMIYARINLIVSTSKTKHQEQLQALTLLAEVANSYLALKNSLTSPSEHKQIINDTAWESNNRLYLGQQLLCIPNDKTSEDFATLLQQIKDRAAIHYTQPCKCCIVNPGVDEKNEQWIVPFLTQLQTDLGRAGIAVEVAEKTTSDHGLYEYLKSFKAEDNIIFVCTQNLLLENQAAIFNELLLINMQRSQNDASRIIYVLLSGELSKAIPAFFMLCTTVEDYSEDSYLTNLKKLIQQLYKIPARDHDYQKLWQRFIGKHSISMQQPFAPTLVARMLAAETTSRESASATSSSANLSSASASVVATSSSAILSKGNSGSYFFSHQSQTVPSVAMVTSISTSVISVASSSSSITTTKALSLDNKANVSTTSISTPCSGATNASAVHTATAASVTTVDTSTSASAPTISTKTTPISRS